MGALLSYSINCGLVLMALYFAYRVFLSADKQPSFNRAVILASYALAFIIVPLASIAPALSGDGSPIPDLAGVALVGVTAAPASSPLWCKILIWLYAIGVAWFTARTIMTWGSIVRLIHRSEKVRLDGFTLVLTDEPGLSPFSWMGYMVISRSDYALCGGVISLHERAHIRLLHSLDLLVAQAVVIINWFNPAAWLMRDELSLVHEYQADMSVLEAGSDPKEYQLLLIKKAVGARFPSLANSLNHSQLKKRLTMMYKSKSSVGARFKALALAPAVAVALIAASAPQVRAAISTIGASSAIDGKVTENSADSKTSTAPASFRIKSVSNSSGNTVITVTAKVPSKSLSVNGASLTSGGQVYFEKGINCSMTNDEATIVLTFPYLDKFSNASLDLQANGANVHLAPAASIEGASQTVTFNHNIIVNGNDPVKYTVDGKEVTFDYLNSIPADKVASMTIDHKTHTIAIITTK